jgi:aryl-alcohol dehydrogenase-like predicted oxidoreductase
MRYRALGKTNIAVSELGFGGVEIGLPYGINRRMMDEEEAAQLLHGAFERGITYFDTARAYGCSEERMGKAFSGMRKNIVICTKCPGLRDENGKIRTGAALRASLEGFLSQSLAALKTDYIDMYLIHSADREMLACDEIIEAFKSLKTKGVARSIGVSTYGFADAELAIEKGWDTIQLAFNLMDQSAAGLFATAREKGTGIVARSVLMRGLLTDNGPILKHEKLRKVEEHKQKYVEFCSKKSISLSDAATKFVLSFDDVSSVLVGIDKMEFLDKAVRIADGRYFDGETLSTLKSMAYPEPEFLDLGKWDRNGWF